MNNPRRVLLTSFFVLIGIFSNIGHAAELNLSYGLVIDKSASTISYLSRMVEAGIAVIAANRPGDEAFVLAFAGQDNIGLIQTITRDKAALTEGVDNLYAEAGKPALIDALYLSIKELDQNAEKKSDRRTALVVLMGDGEESSYYKLDDVIQLIGGRKLPIHIIVFSQNAKRDPAQINALALKTGGKVYFSKSKTDVQGSINEIFAALRR